MKDLFYMGGALFMSILTLLLIGVIAWIVYHLVAFYGGKSEKENTLRNLNYARSIGLFAMITGILGQLIGFYMAFAAIEQAGDVSPALLVGGLKVSMIPTLYGIFIYLLSLLLWFISSVVVDNRKA